MLTGLYVHVPYCDSKCGYCDFYSVALQQRPTAPLVDALLRELDLRLPLLPRVDTIFVGGGTPTVLPLEDLRRLFGRLGEVARAFKVIEFTSEANPATVDPHKIDILVEAGVQRMSYGAQSLKHADLQMLDRLHAPEDIEPGIRMAFAGGIAEVNLDLIFGTPGQTLASWQDTLARASDFGTQHLSCYGLTYEPDTALTARMQRGLLTPCDDGLEADMFLRTVAYLESRGFEQYEISNYAIPGHLCRHSLVYWSNWPYLGIGPSAASYIEGVRSKNVAHIETYITEIERDGAASRDHERLTGQALAGETAMLQLRLTRGIDVGQFKSQVGLDPLEVFSETIAGFASQGLLVADEHSIRLTAHGRLLADRVIREFLS